MYHDPPLVQDPLRHRQSMHLHVFPNSMLNPAKRSGRRGDGSEAVFTKKDRLRHGELFSLRIIPPVEGFPSSFLNPVLQ